MAELSKKDAGVIMALIERFERQRLPTLLQLKEKIDNGAALSNVDIEFLDKVMDDAMRTMPLTEGHPELHSFCAHVVHLYREITTRALQNEPNGP
jgi:hypothetical protein